MSQPIRPVPVRWNQLAPVENQPIANQSSPQIIRPIATRPVAPANPDRDRTPILEWDGELAEIDIDHTPRAGRTPDATCDAFLHQFRETPSPIWENLQNGMEFDEVSRWSSSPITEYPTAGEPGNAPNIELVEPRQSPAALAERQIEPFEIEQREAERLLQQEGNIKCAAVVVAILITLAIIIGTMLSETGSGSPDRGSEFREGNAKLRNDAADGLWNARPSYWSWSGATADNSYASQVGEQQARAEAVADADLQIAHILETQAERIEQAREELGAALAALVGGILVAATFDELRKTAIATCSPAAPAYEAELLLFGMVLAGAVVTTVIAVLIALDDAGKHTKRSLHHVTDTYKWVIDDVAAKTTPAVSVSDTAGRWSWRLAATAQAAGTNGRRDMN